MWVCLGGGVVEFPLLGSELTSLRTRVCGIGHFSDQLPLKENSNFLKDASTLLIILRE